MGKTYKDKKDFKQNFRKFKENERSNKKKSKKYDEKRRINFND